MAVPKIPMAFPRIPFRKPLGTSGGPEYCEALRAPRKWGPKRSQDFRAGFWIPKKPFWEMQKSRGPQRFPKGPLWETPRNFLDLLGLSWRFVGFPGSARAQVGIPRRGPRPPTPPQAFSREAKKRGLEKVFPHPFSAFMVITIWNSFALTFSPGRICFCFFPVLRKSLGCPGRPPNFPRIPFRKPLGTSGGPEYCEALRAPRR